MTRQNSCAAVTEGDGPDALEEGAGQITTRRIAGHVGREVLGVRLEIALAHTRSLKSLMSVRYVQSCVKLWHMHVPCDTLSLACVCDGNTMQEAHLQTFGSEE